MAFTTLGFHSRPSFQGTGNLITKVLSRPAGETGKGRPEGADWQMQGLGKAPKERADIATNPCLVRAT